MKAVQTNTIKNTRVEWIDTAKAFGIILVVLAHALSKDTYLWRFINQFHMPFFFALSGFLYRTKGTLFSSFKKKLVSLYLPYIGVSFLMQAIGWIFWESFSFRKPLKIILMLDMGPLLGATWFIAVLFYAVLLYDVVNRLVTKLKLSLHWITMFAALCFLIGLFIRFPFRLNNILLAVFYIHCGRLMNQYKTIFFPQKRMIRVFLWVCTLAVTAVVSIFSTSSFANHTFSSIGCFVIASLSGTIGLMVFSFGFSETVRCKGLSHHLNFIGSHTIGIVIWQFVAFKLVSLLQILVYGLPIERIADYPIIYEYSYWYWIPAFLLSGIYVSIMIHFLLSMPKKAILRLHKRNKHTSLNK